MEFSMSNIVSILRERSIYSPNQDAYHFIEDDNPDIARITYQELDIKARVIAAFLQEKNVFGERILLLYPAGIDFVAAFMGCLYAGCVAVPIHCPLLTDFEKSHAWINSAAQDADISGVLTTHEFLENVKRYLNTHNDCFIEDTNKLDFNLVDKYQAPEINENTIALLQ